MNESVGYPAFVPGGSSMTWAVMRIRIADGDNVYGWYTGPADYLPEL